jgi:hypothetical protein
VHNQVTDNKKEVLSGNFQMQSAHIQWMWRRDVERVSMLHSEKKKTGNTVVEFQVSPLSICDILEALTTESLVYYMDTE